jgi:hypothetical protein
MLPNGTGDFLLLQEEKSVISKKRRNTDIERAEKERNKDNEREGNREAGT